MAWRQGLFKRRQSGYTKTVLYLAQEVRLCATWQDLEMAERYEGRGMIIVTRDCTMVLFMLI